MESADRAPLDDRKIDALLVIPSDFAVRLDAEQPATFELLNREGDDLSKLAARRVKNILDRYEAAIRVALYARHGLPADFDNPIIVKTAKDGETPIKRGLEEIRDQIAHMFPFLLVMWALAGALHPAIASHRDLSPARRKELGISDGLVRISVGIESVSDIIADIEQALEA
jgi:ABC-type Na+ efflux pump permease subunit